MSSPVLNALGVPLAIALEDLGEQAIVERWTPEGPSADVWFRCYWLDRYTVVKYLRGGTVKTGKNVAYLRPASYPDSPNLLCTAINEIRGRKPRVYQAGQALPTGQVLPGWVYYEYAYIHAHFSVPTWDAIGMPSQDPSGVPMTTTTYRASTEIFAPPTGSFYYNGGGHVGKPVAESSVGIVISRCEISVKRHMLPYPILALIMNNDGVVNGTAMTFADKTVPRGCLLFTGADMEPIADPSTGDRVWDYTFSFMAQDVVEWNEYMDPDGQYVLINDKADGSGDPPFEYVDLTEMFGTSF